MGEGERREGDDTQQRPLATTSTTLDQVNGHHRLDNLIWHMSTMQSRPFRSQEPPNGPRTAHVAVNGSQIQSTRRPTD